MAAVAFAQIPLPGYSIQDVATSMTNAISQSYTTLQASIAALNPGDPQATLNLQLQMAQYTLNLSVTSQSIQALTNISKQTIQSVGQA